MDKHRATNLFMVTIPATNDRAEAEDEDSIFRAARQLMQDTKNAGFSGTRLRANFYSRKSENDPYKLVKADVGQMDLI